jgi:hypothetical protein
MKTTIALLIDRCGLSDRGAADLLMVRIDTIKSWSNGRRIAHPDAIAALRALYRRLEVAANEALQIITDHPSDAIVELGLASDDYEAQQLGWPCVDVHAAVLGLVAARTDRQVRIVPRGSTSATAAAEISN